MRYPCVNERNQPPDIRMLMIRELLAVKMPVSCAAQVPLSRIAYPSERARPDNIPDSFDK